MTSNRHLHRCFRNSGYLMVTMSEAMPLGFVTPIQFTSNQKSPEKKRRGERKCDWMPSYDRSIDVQWSVPVWVTVSRHLRSVMSYQRTQKSESARKYDRVWKNASFFLYDSLARETSYISDRTMRSLQGGELFNLLLQANASSPYACSAVNIEHGLGPDRPHPRANLYCIFSHSFSLSGIWSSPPPPHGRAEDSSRILASRCGIDRLRYFLL